MIALVVPTSNRSRFVGRLLGYLKSVNWTYPIVVADSSSDPERQRNEAIAASTSGMLDVRYQSFLPDANLQWKIAQALGTVESDYAVVCADKDFLTMTGVEQAAGYLESNPEYSVAFGLALSIYTVEPSSLNGGLGAYCRGGPQHSVEPDEAGERLDFHLRHYSGTFYAVHRRKALKRNLEAAADNSVINPYFGELLSSCLSVIQGKAKCLDVLYSVRQSRPDISTARSIPSLSQWLAGSGYPAKYAAFRRGLVTELCESCGWRQGEAERLVDEAFGAYIEQSLSKWAPPPGGGRASFLAVAASRAWYRVGVLPDAIRLALIDGKLGQMLGKSKKTYKALQHERKLRARPDAILTGKLLEQECSHRASFLPIYKSVVRYPDGIPSTLIV